MIPADTVAEMRLAAIASYPREAVFAYWPDGSWRELDNIHSQPRAAFRVGGDDLKLLEAKPPLVLVHTHTSGNPEPSDLDTAQQLRCGYVWAIMCLSGNGTDEVYQCSDPEYFGNGAPPAPLIGRQYLWGVRDCYTLVQGYYAINGAPIPCVPRVREPGQYKPNHPYAYNLFNYWIPRCGFKPIATHLVMPGDVVVMNVSHAYPDHCAVVLGEGKYLEHTATRSSGVRHHRSDVLERMNARYYRHKDSNAKDRSSWSIEGPLSRRD